MTKETKIDTSFVLSKAKDVKQEDFERVEVHAKEIQDKTQQGPLNRFFDDVRTFIEMVKDYRARRYREIPYWAITMVVFALAYVLMPVDLVPDFILGLGLVDDAAVMSVCVMMLNNQLEAYRAWRLEHHDYAEEA